MIDESTGRATRTDRGARYAVAALLGGPLTPEQRQRTRTHAGMALQLSTSAAAREPTSRGGSVICIEPK